MTFLTETEIKRIKMLGNMVLVKPDPDYETFQVAGKETGIYTSPHPDAMGQNLSVKGIVYAAPTKLLYYGTEINVLQESIRDAHEMSERRNYVQKQIDDYKRKSVLYDVPVEIEAGDRVAFFYKNHIDCHRAGLVFDTPHGEMLLMKYDTLIYTVDAEDKFLKMLNGYLLIDHVPEVEKTESGIYLYRSAHTDFTKKPKVGLAKILSSGCLCNGYLEAFGNRDGRHFDYDKTIIYNPRYAKNMEYDLHQKTFDKKLYRIHRKDVFGFVEDQENPGSEKSVKFMPY